MDLNLFNKPTIIPRQIEYKYEPNYYLNDSSNVKQNTTLRNDLPKLILILENKSVDVHNEDPIKTNYAGYEIDYSNTDVNSGKNIFNYMNREHANLIRSIKNDNFSFLSDNENFAYHFFIDKMGNIYEGRPLDLRPYNLDIKDINGNIIQDYNLLKDYLVILTEEDTSNKDTTERTYASLRSLILYLMDEYGFKEFYGYSELNKFELTVVDKEEDDILKYNNPGIFFKINELHSNIDGSPKTSMRKTTSGYEIYTYGQRVFKYLRDHMSGNDITMLQIMLYTLGYFTDYKNICGAYNLATKNAVEEFQRNDNIIPVFEYGVADIPTLNRIRNIIYKAKMNKQIIFDENNCMYRTLEYIEGNNMVGYDVKFVQQLLKEKVLYSLEITGIYDEYTMNTVKFFQKIFYGTKNDKIADGKVGPNTLQMLKNCNYKIPEDGIFIPKSSSIKNENIVLLQRALNNFLSKFGIEIKVNGFYNESTAECIKRINNIKDNREIMGINYYAFDEEGNEDESYWTEENLRKCYPEEYEWLLSHYILKDYNGIKI